MGKLLKNRVVLLFIILFPFQNLFAQGFSIQIEGEVRHAGVWSISDLKNMPQIPVKVREYSHTQYSNVSVYWGVPLQMVLETVGIQKSVHSTFKHKSDMVIWLRNADGERIALSWGQIFYASEPTHYLLAWRKKIIQPTAHPKISPKSCKNCHNGRTVKKGRILRPISKESLSGIAFLECKEGTIFSNLLNLQEIKVESVDRKLPRKNDRNQVFSSQILLYIGGKVVSLDRFLEHRFPSMISYKLAEIGSGCGYHGTFQLEGFPLDRIFKRQLAQPHFWGLLVSAPDGYRTFVSKSEIVGDLGGKAFLAVRKNGKPLFKPEGKYMLVLPNDLYFDRWIRAVDRIEILSGFD